MSKSEYKKAPWIGIRLTNKEKINLRQNIINKFSNLYNENITLHKLIENYITISDQKFK